MKEYIPSIERIREWQEQVDYCKDNLHKLTEREVGFIDSCDKALDQKGEISRKQSSWLRDIFYRIS